MKLYTEEQIREAIQFSRTFAVHAKTEDIIILITDKLTPIELPSDEEINEKAKDNSAWEYNHETNFKLGARWLKEQILNQNK